MYSDHLSMRKIYKGCIFYFLFTFSLLAFLSIPQKAEAVKFYWTTQTVDSAGNVGYYTSIALDSLNKAHISYYDDSNADLKYATNASGSWVLQTVDSNGWGHTSIALDSSNKAYISYLTGPNYDLKYATNASGSWVSQTVDSAGGVGIYTSIALDSSNKAYISYYDYTNTDLKYATNATGEFGSGLETKQTVESAGSVGAYTSIALDSSNILDVKAYISYTYNSPSALKYATNASGSWVLQTVDAVGGYTSIALDSLNKAYISYTDQINGDLKYATNASGSWVLQTVDSAGFVGYDTSIALDSLNKAYISYYDGSNGDLKFAFSEAGNTSDDVNNGEDLQVDLGGGYLITYDDVNGDGRTLISTRETDLSGSNSFLSDPEVGYMLNDTVYKFTIEDATFTGGFYVQIPYNEVDIPGGFTEDQLRLFHYLGSGNVEDITVSVNTGANYVLGYATSFSDFGVGVNPEPATLLLLGSALLGLLPLRKKLF